METSANGFRQRRGFAVMSSQERARIAAMGGREAHARGTAHQFDTEEARQAGRKGGRAHSREHMQKLGRIGGRVRAQYWIARRADLASKRQPLQPDELQRLMQHLTPAQAIFVQVALLTGFGRRAVEALRPEHIETTHPGLAALLPVEPWPRLNHDLARACTQAEVPTRSYGALKATGRRR